MLTIDEIRERAVPIARQYGVKKMGLFGSYARGEQTEESDLDFVIEYVPGMGWSFYGMADELENEFGVHIDLLSYNGLKNSWISDVLDDEIILYDDFVQTGHTVIA